MLWSRRPPEGLDLERGERMLARATDADGSVVVATDLALHVPGPEGFTRLPWDGIDHAGWREGVLEVRMVDEAEAAHHVRLPEPGSVPETVRERVTATVVASRHATLTDGARVRLVARRPPYGEAEPRWMMRFDTGADAADPDLRAEAERLLADYRSQTGL